MALFSLGMRPFYLLAGAFAALAIPVRALQYTGWVPRTEAFWHGHEMLFGFAFAVIAGFLLSAVRVWTQRETVAGFGLATLAGIWVAARVLAFFSLPAAVAVDVVFAIGLAIAIGRPLIASGNRRNYFFIALMLGMGAASVGFHANPRFGLGIGLDIVLLVMAVIGGRVIPMFTNSGVPGAGAGRTKWSEFAAIGSLIALLAADLAGLEKAAAAVAAIAALAHAIRLALWRPQRTLGKPIVWILHVSYAWIVVHLALRALAGLELVAPTLATHALTAGAIGGMTIGMMTRTARGHTGRPLEAGVAEVCAYVLIHAAALARVVLPIVLPAGYLWWIAIAAALWSAGFAVFTIRYLPILARPRVDGRPD